MARTIGKAGFKMKGMDFGNSPVKQDEKQVPLSEHEKKKGTKITGGSQSEVINDLEDRIEYLRSDLQGGGKDKVSIMEVGRQLAKLQTRLKKERAKK